VCVSLSTDGPDQTTGQRGTFITSYSAWKAIGFSLVDHPASPPEISENGLPLVICSTKEVEPIWPFSQQVRAKIKTVPCACSSYWLPLFLIESIPLAANSRQRGINMQLSF